MKNIKYVLFDLDGTLLPLDQDVFTEKYFKELTDDLTAHGYEKDIVTKAVWAGVFAAIKNDGKMTNELVFWHVFREVFGDRFENDKEAFDSFYVHAYDNVKEVCGYTPRAKEAVELVKARGRLPVLATNPVFPAIATQKRIGWAGLAPEDFVLYTTYENFSSAKPSKRYYTELLEKLGAKPEECIMIGNDATEDMVAKELGIEVFLLTDCLLNKKGVDISVYNRGGFDELLAYLDSILT